MGRRDLEDALHLLLEPYVLLRHLVELEEFYFRLLDLVRQLQYRVLGLLLDLLQLLGLVYRRRVRLCLRLLQLLLIDLAVRQQHLELVKSGEVYLLRLQLLYQFCVASPQLVVELPLVVQVLDDLLMLVSHVSKVGHQRVVVCLDGRDLCDGCGKFFFRQRLVGMRCLALALCAGDAQLVFRGLEL